MRKDKSNLFFNAGIFLIYCLVILIAMKHHELWGDEIHSWNIVKGSHSLGELFQHIRYEGHPPFWYIILFAVTRFSHSLFFLKAAQFTFVAASATVILFFSPFSKTQKLMLICGYYFIYEYAVLARNYMPAVFFAFCIAAIQSRDFKYKKFCYYLLLLVISDVHLLGLLLAISIHAGFCFGLYRKKLSFGKHIIIAALVFLPAIYFILPPTDSQLNYSFWIEHWSASRLLMFATVIVKSFFPVLVANTIHWWNSNYFLDDHSLFGMCISGVIFCLVLFLIFMTVKKNKTALMIVSVNLLLTFLLSLIFPLNTARYAGFVFIGLIAATWFGMKEEKTMINTAFLTLIFILQIPMGVFAIVKDHNQNFSSASKVVEMQNKIPTGSFIATDYWCLDNLSAYLDTSFYCIELKRPASFLMWNSEMKNIKEYDYVAGLTALVTGNESKTFYFFSMHDLDELVHGSSPPLKFRFTLLQDSGECIEKSGRVYLYKIEQN